ncbi:MAG: TRAP transporter small permease subunit [Betaproteobacteria bacterium]|nr:MAG: TRAP transporter small permease subunit [Betaproteobacteria bacterium]TMH45533.1 MAG: TRAP transporter small permease subunit [Betaproteobacteria bacterium]
MDAYVRAVRRLSQLCGIVAAALIALGVVVVCEMVFVRYVLNQNTIWQTDFVTWSLVAATFIGSPYLLLTRGHVNVDVLPLHLRPRARWWLALASIVMSLAFCIVLAVLTSRFWLEAWEQRWVSDTMWRARLWIPYSSMPIGLGILVLQYIADLYALVSGRAPPFGIKS